MAKIYELRLSQQVIRTTAEHPFWVKGKGWVRVGDVEPGDLVSTDSGQWLKIDRIVDTQTIETVYNLRVSDYHTYFVGSSKWGFSVWAHNASCQEVSAVATRRVRLRFDATNLSDDAVDKAIAKSIRRKSGATGLPSGSIAASSDQVEFILNKTTAWRRNVHAANPHLGALPANMKGTILHGSVAKRMRSLNVAGLDVNRRLYSPFHAPGTSQHISRGTGLPYTYRIPDYKVGNTILDIKPTKTPITGPQVDDFMSFANTSDVRFIFYNPF